MYQIWTTENKVGEANHLNEKTKYEVIALEHKWTFVTCIHYDEEGSLQNLMVATYRLPYLENMKEIIANINLSKVPLSRYC